ncbi:MAG: hypothetical protein DMF25_03155 [Verrucomicrobia bacterium]|nr:MAG: hypothetical protein DMF25_03155 [Verrucomicrobiota bacterium]
MPPEILPPSLRQRTSRLFILRGRETLERTLIAGLQDPLCSIYQPAGFVGNPYGFSPKQIDLLKNFST